ncbi:MAG: DUF5719 family protein [Frankiaceae bacterium]
MRRPPGALVAVLAVAGTAVGVTSAVLGPQRPAAPAAPAAAVVPVTDATLVCPDPSGVPGRQRTTVGAAASPGVDAGTGGESDGTVAGGVLGEPAADLLRGPGRAATRSFAGSAGPYVVTATGPVAAGLEAVQLSRTDGGAERGLAGARCVRPATRFAFVGVGTKVGEDPRLYLTNAGDVPALVDLSLTGTAGPLPSTAGQGLRVGAHQRVVLRLVGLVPDQAALAVTVTARSGRIAAALRDTRRQGDRPGGVDWVPPAAAAARTLVLPGIDWHAGQQLLTIADPGPTAAAVRVQVVRGDGSFVPSGLDAVAVPAGRLRTVDLTEAVGGRGAAVRLVSDRPVRAGLTSTLAGAGDYADYADTAFATATRPVSDVVVPLLPIDPRLHQVAGVQLVAAEGAATVTVRPIGGGPARPLTRSLAPGTMGLVDVAADLRARGAVALELHVLPGSGPVHAAAYWYEQGTRGPMLTVVELASPARTLAVPALRPDQLAPYAGARDHSSS